MKGESKLGPPAALAPEAVVRLSVDGERVVTWSCTPSALDALTAGWLVCEGIIREPGEILELALPPADEPDPVVRARLGAAAARRLRGLLEGEAAAIRPVGLSASVLWSEPVEEMAHGDLRALLENRGRLAEMFRDMFDRAPLRASVGGVHTGGLVRAGDLELVVEDVSRHHVVDRLVGAALLSGATSVGCALLLSSRISGAMAAKACRAGVAALVSRSIPTELAVSVARGCGLVLVGRGQREEPHIHWPA